MKTQKTVSALAARIGLFCLVALALLLVRGLVGRAEPQRVKAACKVNAATSRGGARDRSRTMADPQLVTGGAAITLTQNNTLNPSPATSPPTGFFSVWEGGTQVVPNTPYTSTNGGARSTTVTVNGITFSQFDDQGQGFVEFVTLQAASGSTVPAYTGAYVLVSAPRLTSTFIVDFVAGAAPSPPRNLSVATVY